MGRAREQAKAKERAKGRVRAKERERARRAKVKVNTVDSSTLTEVSSDNQRIQLMQGHISSLITLVPLPMLPSVTNLDQAKLTARPGRLCMRKYGFYGGVI